MTHLTQVIATRLTVLLTTTTRRPQHDQRGSVTIQEVLWAIASIAFVAIVVAAITAYLNGKAGVLAP